MFNLINQIYLSWTRFFPELNIKFNRKNYQLTFCHALPERSFHIGKYQFPICSRCTGIFLGILFSIILMNYLDIPLFLLIIFMLPLIVDGFLQLFNLRKSNNTFRFVTGLMFGIALL